MTGAYFLFSARQHPAHGIRLGIGLGAGSHPSVGAQPATALPPTQPVAPGTQSRTRHPTGSDRIPRHPTGGEASPRQGASPRASLSPALGAPSPGHMPLPASLPVPLSLMDHERARLRHSSADTSLASASALGPVGFLGASSGGRAVLGPAGGGGGGLLVPVEYDTLQQMYAQWREYVISNGLCAQPTEQRPGPVRQAEWPTGSLQGASEGGQTGGAQGHKRRAGPSSSPSETRGRTEQEARTPPPLDGHSCAEHPVTEQLHWADKRCRFL